jgi:hypothetical protein
VTYHAVPARRVQGCPSKRFDNEADALSYAERCARLFRVAYATWRVGPSSTLRLVRLARPPALPR